ncbi:hypothetical protein ACTXNT_22280, partial [Pseudomonas helleri]
LLPLWLQTTQRSTFFLSGSESAWNHMQFIQHAAMLYEVEVRCPQCDSQLVRVDDPTLDPEGLEFVCMVCLESSSYEAVMVPALVESLAGINYVNVKDGGDACSETCHECGNDTFLVEHGRCAICFAELDYTGCALCSSSLGVHDQDFGGLCSYHHHLAHKDD